MTIKSIEITEEQWIKLYNQLSKDYPPSYIIIRENMKDKLGFVFRRHKNPILPKIKDSWKLYREQCFLDFFDEKKKTMFLLKYSEFLGKTQT